MSLSYVGPIKDERINGLIKECLQITREVYPEIDQAYNWVTFGNGGTASSTFGYCKFPKAEYGDFIILLNELIFDADDNYIKRTILHELAHYVDGLHKLEKGIIWWDEGRDEFLIKRSTNRSKEYRSHGLSWRKIADELEKASGLKINSTDDLEDFPTMKKVVDNRKKYMFQCKYCQKPFGYERETDFVRNYNKVDKDGYPRWRCSVCHHGYNKGEEPPFVRIN